MLRGASTQLALTCSAGTASPHPGVRSGTNSLEKEDPTHTHVWSALPVKRSVATAIPIPSSTRPQSCSRPGAEPVRGSGAKGPQAPPAQRLLLVWPVWVLLGESAPARPSSQQLWAPAQSAHTGRADSCPGQGRAVPAQWGRPPRFLCRAQDCRLPSTAGCPAAVLGEGSAPCLQTRLEHPQACLFS